MGNRPSLQHTDEIVNFMNNEFLMSQTMDTVKKLGDPTVCRNLIEHTTDQLYRILTPEQVLLMIKYIKQTVPDVVVEGTDDEVRYNERVSKEQRILCSHIARFYIQIGHLVSVILETLEPTFQVGDKRVNYLYLEKIAVGENIVPVSYNFCSHRLNAVMYVEDERKSKVKLIPSFCSVEQGFFEAEPAKEEPIVEEPMVFPPNPSIREPSIREPVYEEPIREPSLPISSFKQPMKSPSIKMPTISRPISQSSIELENELTQIIDEIATMERERRERDEKYKTILKTKVQPVLLGGVLSSLMSVFSSQKGGGRIDAFPELKHLYYDTYNPDTNQFDIMSDASQQKYTSDLSELHYVLTGEYGTPESFSKLPLLASRKIYEKCTTPEYKDHIETHIKDPIYRDIARSRSKLMSVLKSTANGLFSILKQLVMFDEKTAPRVHPNLDFYTLNVLTKQTREKVLKMNSECEQHYKKMGMLWDKLILQRKDELQKRVENNEF
jgi:hypothetical protein